MDNSRNAVEAKQILEHRLFQGAFNGLRDKLVEEIEMQDFTDDVRRDKLMLSLQMLKAVKGSLEQHIMEGNMDNINTEWL